MRQRVLIIAFFVVLLALWEGVVRFGVVNRVVLASPSAIVGALPGNLGIIFENALLTSGTILFTIAITWLVGILVGMAFGSLRSLHLVGGAVLSSMFAVPMIVWFPVILVWFGIGPPSKVVFAALLGVFPIALAAMEGVKSIDAGFRDLGRSFGARRLVMMFRIYLPLALPSIVSGLRVGTSLIVIGVIVTEMLASFGGLGYWIAYNQTLFNTAEVYLGILVSLIFVFAINTGLTALEKHLGKWRFTQAAP